MLTALGFVVMIVVVGVVSLRYVDRMTQARLAIAQSKATLDEALESMVSGFVVLDSQLRLVQWNRRFEEIYPWLKGATGAPGSVQGIAERESPAPPGKRQRRRAAALGGAARGSAAQPQGPHEQGLPDGRVIQVTERATPDGGLVITYHDVTELRQASAEIENLAFYDPLTGLPNRRL